ncbi:MAG: alanine racemase [Spirochaetes bacterium]|nr:alanine racemase [Spirochaetota bacterium]
MKKKIIIATTIIGAIVLIIALKPGDNGKPYSTYFANLNTELKNNGPGRPVILVDLDRLDKNIATVKKNLHPSLKFRLTVKSIPCPWLIDYILTKMNSRYVMVFHGPDITFLANNSKNYDILLGKPMPLNAVKEFYNSLKPGIKFDPEKQIQWLVDTPARLTQYYNFAKQNNIRMKINIEIDVGLHRGGVTTVEQLDKMLATIYNNPQYLQFSGFMGYEVHSASALALLGSKKKAILNAFNDAMERYKTFFNYSKQKYPTLFKGKLTCNSGGSHTYMLFDGTPPVNDIAMGSALLKPKDFDKPLLTEHVEALFVATPVLKRLEGTTIPFIEGISNLMAKWNPNRQVTYFIYGGGWRAHYYSPQGLIENTIYGFSTNQAIVNGSRSTALQVDDYIFLLPTQSEAIMREFGDVVMIRNGKIAGRYPALPQ